MTMKWLRFDLNLLDTESLHTLSASGWFPGRVRDPSADFQLLLKNGCLPFPEASAVLVELD